MGEAGLIEGLVLVEGRGGCAESHLTAQILEVGIHGEWQPQLLPEEAFRGSLAAAQCRLSNSIAWRVDTTRRPSTATWI